MEDLKMDKVNKERDNKLNILDLTLKELGEVFQANGEKKFRAKQVSDYIYRGAESFDDMKNLGASSREFLKENFYLDIPHMVKLLTSKDGTRKGLLKFRDGNIVEAVLMKYEYGYSVCISTQVGCRMGCSFCSSTKEGLVRSLTPGEMMGEVLAMTKAAGERISNMVLMGAGEPFDNYENVMKFLRVITSKDSLNIGQRHITVSTCGLAPQIKRFADEDTQITLAISLHETTDERRKKLMPVAYRYSLTELFNAIKYYCDRTGRRVTFEYALVKDVNDDQESAVRLSGLLKDIKSHVNLIPLNETKDTLLKKPDMKRVEEFKKILDNFNIETTVRREMGSDISAACGQLKRGYESEKRPGE